jgi:hypothetical protein
MHRAFLTGNPKPDELKLLKKFIATYRDGTGGNRELDGSSRADSRQLERCFAELLHGTTSENKAFYDFVVEFNEGGGIAVRGASLKSKEIADIASYKPNSTTTRAHLELSNSSAKDWKACREEGLTEANFLSHMHANKFGEVILQRQTTQRLESEAAYLKKRKGTGLSFIQDECVYISVLYSPGKNKGERQWIVSTFKASLPQPASWGFQGKALVGYETNGDRLYEWYALSGSQFKYYPKLATRLYGTSLFTVPRPSVETLRAKSERLFGP